MSRLKVPKRLQGNKTAAHHRSPRQEKETADRLGGVVIKGSGCGDTRGDSRVRGVVRLENKCTSHKSFSVTQSMLDKIEEAALGAGEVPVIEIEFLDSRGKPSRSVVVMPTWALDIMVRE